MSDPAIADPPAPPVPARSSGSPAQGPTWTAQFLEGLREMGPVVWVMGLMSVTLPGIVGTFVLFGSVAKAERAQRFVEGLGPNAPWIVLAIFGVATGSAIAPTYALSFACGALFGSLPVAGSVAMGGVVLGALIGYGWGALLARKRVMDVVNRHEKARIIRHALLDRPIHTEAWVVGLIRFPPNSPFALTNLVMSSLRVRLAAFFTGTLLGMMPRTVFAVWIGVKVGDLAKAQSASKDMRLIIGAVIGVAVFVVVYRIMSKWARQALAEHATQGAGQSPGESS